MVVDSGVHDYDESSLRQFVRSTAAHNTVRVDNMEQSEIWGAFRIARRAKPVSAALSDWEDGCLEFSGAHDGYRRLPGKPVHERRIRMDSKGVWSIQDSVTGTGEHLIESFVHIHPDFRLTSEDMNTYRVHDDVSTICRLTIGSDCEVKTLVGKYCPEFGKQSDNSVLVLSLRGSLPLTLAYSIQKV